MGKHKSSRQDNHFYLGLGGLFAIAALVVALTFGLSSAQMMDPAAGCTQMGGTWNGTMCNMPSSPSPSAQSCGSGQYWNGSSCQQSVCASGMTGTPPNCVSSTPATVYCPNGTSAPNNDMAQCPKCPDGVTVMPASPGVCPSTTPVQTVGSCTTGQWWDASTSTCRTSTTGTTGTEPQCNWSTQYMKMSTHTCEPRTNCTTTGSTEYNSSECQGVRGSATGMNGSQTNQVQTVGSCTAGQWWDAATSTCKNTTMGSCTTGQWWDSSTSSCKNNTTGDNLVNCPSMSGSPRVTPEACAAATPVCAQGEQPTSAKPCRYADTNMMQNTNMENTYFRPGECPAEMQQCPDSYNPANTVCMPKKTYWDMKTQTSIPGGKDATCADFQPMNQSMTGPNRGQNQTGMRGPQLPFFGGEQRTGNPCDYNPNDPFCRSGVNFNDLTKGLKFNEQDFNPANFEIVNKKRSVREIKAEARQVKRDLDRIKMQLTEIGRESSGFACPAGVEVDAIASEMQNFVDTAGALNESSGEEEIGLAQAMREHVNGSFDPETGENIPGLRQQLFGGPPDEETGEPTPGKMEGLNSCREFSNAGRAACDAYERVSQEYNSFKEGGMAQETLAVFEEVLPQLKDRCENPLDVLAELGVSLDELFQPFRPDPEICSYGGGRFGGPMPMSVGSPFPGGGPGPFPGGDLPPEMLELMKQKFMEFSQNGAAGTRGSAVPGPGFRGSPFGTSVLTAQNGALSMPCSIDGEDGLPRCGGGGFEGPPPVCQPPVWRYLGIDTLMRKLDQARAEVGDHFERINACDMFTMGQKKFKEEDKRGGMRFLSKDTAERIKAILFTDGPAACDSGDTDLVESLRGEMFRYFGRGGSSRSFNLIDIDKTIQDKLKLKLEQFTDDDNSSDAKILALTKKLDDLQSALTEAQKTIASLSEQIQNMMTQVATSIELSDKAKHAIGTIAALPTKAVQNSVANNISDLTAYVERIKKLASAEVGNLLDATMNNLIQSPPSATVFTQIRDGLAALESYVGSGADPEEVLAKAKDELATIAVLNASDSGKVSAGICATNDTCDLSQWYAGPVSAAKFNGFVAADLQEYKPAEAETNCAAITRTARILEKRGQLTIDESNHEPVASAPGAPEWCRPFIRALNSRGVPYVASLKNPNAPATRLGVAILISQSLGDLLPAPSNAAEYLTPDTQNLSAAERAAVAAMRYYGIMDTTDGEHFGPAVTFNRAQNAVVTVKAYEAVAPAAETAPQE